MRFLFSVVLAVGCSSTAPPVKPPPPTHGDPPMVDAPTTPVTAEPSPTDRECDDLVAHAITLHIVDIRAKTTAQQHPRAEDIARLTAELRNDPGCRSLSRAAYRCAIAAKSLATLAACGQ